MEFNKPDGTVLTYLLLLEIIMENKIKVEVRYTTVATVHLEKFCATAPWQTGHPGTNANGYEGGWW